MFSLNGSWRYIIVAVWTLPIVHLWWFEIVCCLPAIGALFGVAVTIGFRQRRPLPEWPYSLTVNSVISIFILILKTAAALVLSAGVSQLKWNWFAQLRPVKDIETYDEASRGPWGAIKLLWVVKHRQISASLAAIIVISALALDPLAQQLIRYYDCLRPQPNFQGTIPRTQKYDESCGVLCVHYSFYGATGQGYDIDPAPGMLDAIEAGVYTPDATQIQFVCPSGNCSFPDTYATFGWCSECEDVSHQLRWKNRTAYHYYGNTTFYFPEVSLPSGARATTNYYAAQVPFTMQSVWDDALRSTTTEVIYLDSFYDAPSSMQTDPPDLANCPTNCPSDPSNSSDWCCRRYGAARCHLYPCMSRYNADVKGGVLNETRLSTSPRGVLGHEWKAGEPNLAAVDLTCISSEQRQRLKDVGYQIHPDMQWSGYNVSIQSADGSLLGCEPNGNPCLQSFSNGTTVQFNYFPNNLSESDILKYAGNDAYVNIVPRHCIYQSSIDSVYDLGEYLTAYFSGALFYNETNSVPPFIVQLYNTSHPSYKSVDSLFKGLSGSMTRYIRQHGNANYSELAIAVVYANSTCLRVEWLWLIFPSAFVALLLLFSVTMVFQTKAERPRNQQDFKSSSLALLFHGLDNRVMQTLGEKGVSNSVDALKQDAKGVLVRFGMTDRGWAFVGDGEGEKMT